MIVMTIKMVVLPAKRNELVQTLHELRKLVCKEPGYLYSHIYRAPENENLLTFVEAWATQTDLDHHMQSHYSEVLQGALKLLTASSEISWNAERESL